MRSDRNGTTLLTEGSILGKLFGFAVPLFLGNLFQQLYNTCDSLIVGNFAGSEALAAVSSSGSLIFLLVGLFNGIAMGAGVVIARYFGAREGEHLRRAIHATVFFGIVAGAALTVLGILLTPLLLRWMGTPETVLPQSIHLFPGLLRRGTGCGALQCGRGCFAGGWRFQTPAVLPDDLLRGQCGAGSAVCGGIGLRGRCGGAGHHHRPEPQCDPGIPAADPPGNGVSGSAGGRCGRMGRC